MAYEQTTTAGRVPAPEEPTANASRRRPERRVRRLRTFALVTVAAGSIVLAGCGSSEPSAAGDTGVQAAGSSDMEAFTECLAENGVEMPDMSQGGQPPQGGEGGAAAPGGDSDAFAAAQEACADLMPEGGVGGGAGGPGGAGGGAAMTEYTDCLAENGVEVAQPDAAGGAPPAAADGSTGAAPAAGNMFGLDESDPAVATAMEACASLLPEMPSGAPGAQGGGTDSQSGADSQAESS